MNQQSPQDNPPHASVSEDMLTPKEFAKAKKVSLSWLAKARKRGDGPPFIRFGRSVRYFPLVRPEQTSVVEKCRCKPSSQTRLTK